MQLSLDGEFIDSHTPLAALALHGYAVFTTFAVTRHNKESWCAKGLHFHEQRLQRDAQALFGLEPDFNAIYAATGHFLSQTFQDSTLILRITLFPQDFSMMTPETVERLHVFVSGRPLSHISQPLRLQSIEAMRIFPQHKTGNLLVNLKARRMAREAGMDDALLCIDNWIMEGAGWNVFFSDGERLLTPPLTHHLLPGVTRRLIMDAAHNGGIEVVEKAIHKDHAASYSGAFASNAAAGVVPIALLDDTTFDTSDALIRRVAQLYDDIDTTALSRVA